MQAAPLNEALFMALLFSMIRLPDPIRDTHQRAQQLRLEVARLVLRFREKGTYASATNKGLTISCMSISPGAEPKFIHDWHR